MDRLNSKVNGGHCCSTFEMYQRPTSKRGLKEFFPPHTLKPVILYIPQNFRNTYLRSSSYKTMGTSDIFKEIGEGEFIYISNYNYTSKTGFNFTYEKFKDNVLFNLLILILK